MVKICFDKPVILKIRKQYIIWSIGFGQYKPSVLFDIRNINKQKVKQKYQSSEIIKVSLQISKKKTVTI